jgi:hypothetical protein
MAYDINLPAIELKSVTVVEAARKVRAVLRAAFPKTKISTTSHWGLHVEWSDTGPSRDEVKAALLAAPFVTTREHYSGTTLLADNYSIYLDCYNVAEREAAERDQERWREEYAEQRQRENEAVKQAWQAKRTATQGLPLRQDDLKEQPPGDPAIFEAFDRLRQRAEVGANLDGCDRRPSWAPPLILGEELGEACLALGYLTLDDKWIGRLWAHFATPKRSGRYVREHASRHTLPGIACRGFQLFAGGARGTMSTLLFEAQRETSGEWRFGPWVHFHDYCSPRAREWERLIRERETLRHTIEHHNFTEEAQTANEARLAAIASRPCRQRSRRCDTGQRS